MYEELAEKEQALLMAAQFGKNLIDEKEELEKQIEMLKREHQLQLEVNFFNIKLVIFSNIFLKNSSKFSKNLVQIHKNS